LHGLSGYGHGFSEENLGNKPLLSERALFTVEGRAGSTWYLRTQAYDSFTGNGWTLSSGHPDRQSIGHLPVAPEANGAGRVLLRLGLLMDYYPFVPQILGAATVLPGRSGEGLEYDGSPATGLALDRPLLYGERILVGGNDWLLSESGSTQLTDDPSLYLALPQNIPSAARELAASLQGLTEAELTDALASLLDKGFTYSLEPAERTGIGAGNRTPQGYGDRMGDTGFLQVFLAETRTGYCVHFASAAVLLARLAGVPARYVTGFLVSIPQPAGDFLEAGSGGLVRSEITGLNSHAWVELWLPSVGWTNFEATPPMRQAATNASGFGEATMDDFTLRQLAAITGGRIDLREAGRAGSDRLLTPARLALVLLVLGFALSAGFALYRLAGKAGWQLDWLSDWWLGNPAGRHGASSGLSSFRNKAKRVVHLAAALGVPEPERSGWLLWEKDLAALLERHGIDLDKPAQPSAEAPVPTPVPTPVLSRADLVVYREVFFGCRSPQNLESIRASTLEKYLKGLSRRR
jgi:hypothetical protein